MPACSSPDYEAPDKAAVAVDLSASELVTRPNAHKDSATMRTLQLASNLQVLFYVTADLFYKQKFNHVLRTSGLFLNYIDDAHQHTCAVQLCIISNHMCGFHGFCGINIFKLI